MAKEIRGGLSVESHIAPSLKKKFKAFCKKNNITQAEWIRNQIQGLFKRK
jgi:dihydrodipicolinate synthase/N-acetylneuraminate lyase